MSKKYNFKKFSEKTPLTKCPKCSGVVRVCYAVGKKGLGYKVFNSDWSEHNCKQ